MKARQVDPGELVDAADRDPGGGAVLGKHDPARVGGPFGEVVLDVRQEPPQFIWWLIIALVVIFYLLLHSREVL